MKRAMIFVGLKVVEFIVAAIVYFICHLVGFYGFIIHVEKTVEWGDKWIGAPFVGAFMIGVGFAIVFGLYKLVQHNWRKAGDLARGKE